MAVEQRAEYFDRLVLRNLGMSRYVPTEDTIETASRHVSAAEETGNLALVASARLILGFVNLHCIRLPHDSIARARELKMHEYVALATANLSWGHGSAVQRVEPA